MYYTHRLCVAQQHHIILLISEILRYNLYVFSRIYEYFQDIEIDQILYINHNHFEYYFGFSFDSPSFFFENIRIVKRSKVAHIFTISHCLQQRRITHIIIFYLILISLIL